MTPIGKKRLLKLADILDAADAQHRAKKEPTYDQTRISHDCGTPACAIGHWAGFSNGRVKRDRTTGFVSLRDDDETSIVGIAESEFGIDEYQSDELFESYGCGGAKTAKQAARYIRKFVRRVEREQWKAVA